MKWVDRLDSCVQYIEDNLTDEIDMNVLADKACLSKFYFYRMFLYVTGIPINEYIRKRKMTLAASQLLNTECRVIDLAFDLGYSSSEAFSRAFKKIHGVSPAEIRHSDYILKAYPPISFQIQIKGDIEMNYKIVKKEKIQVIGISQQFSTENGDNFRQIPKFWGQFNESDKCERLFNYSTEDKIYGISMNYDEDTETFDYLIAVPYNGKEISDKEFKAVEIPESSWAVFEVVGPMPNAIQEVTKRIFNEWLPATKYELTDGPQLEVYPDGDVARQDYKSEIWMPVSINE